MKYTVLFSRPMVLTSKGGVEYDSFEVLASDESGTISRLTLFPNVGVFQFDGTDMVNLGELKNVSLLPGYVFVPVFDFSDKGNFRSVILYT